MPSRRVAPDKDPAFPFRWSVITSFHVPLNEFRFWNVEINGFVPRKVDSGR